MGYQELSDEEIERLPGHWHIHANESLRDEDAEPICLRFDQHTLNDLHYGIPKAWQALIMVIEADAAV